MSWTRTLCACATFAVVSSGCANLMTSRAIDAFSASLAEGDAQELKKVASDRFAQQALRLPEAGDDFKILNVPKGKLTVLQTDDLSDDKKHVTVQVGDSDDREQTLEFHLIRPDGERRWVVDDVFITQNNGGRGGPVTKSVTEQMDLLLTVREFVAAWQSGTRQEVLEITNEDLRQVLTELPPAYLNQITKQTVERVNLRSFRPEARIDEDRAVVKLSRSRNGLMVSLARQNDRWLVTDVAAEDRDSDSAASVRIMAGVVKTAVDFMNAYAAEDRDAMSAASDPAFDKKLKGADLSTVPLPVVGLLAARYEYRHHGDSVDFILPHGSSKYIVNLKRQEREKPKGLNRIARYAVNEVTLFEDGSNEIKRLSSLFTVHAVVELFAEALVQRDRTRLMALSTPEFNERAWVRASDVVLQAIPLTEIESERPRVIATVYQGPVTEVTVTQGGKPLTYVLNSGRNAMLVDDVLLPTTGRPNSLKTNVELLAPLYGFAMGVHHHDMELLNQHSGTGLRRMVWSHSSSVPDIGIRMQDYLNLPLRTIKTGDDRSLVELSDGSRTTRVIMMREGPRVVVQDVQFTAGDGPGEQIQLLQALRNVVTQRNMVHGGGIKIPRGVVADGPDRGAINQASDEGSAGRRTTPWSINEPEPGGVIHADAQTRPAPWSTSEPDWSALEPTR